MVKEMKLMLMIYGVVYVCVYENLELYFRIWINDECKTFSYTLCKDHYYKF